MKYLITIFLIMLVNWYSVSADWKIINGTQAIMHEYPQLVSIRIDDEHVCGGSLLNGNTVLTAAHCLWEIRHWPLGYLVYHKVQVVFGEYDLNNKTNVEKYFQVTQLIIHNSYRNAKAYIYGNDIALLKFDGFISNDQFDYIKYTILDTKSMTKPGDRCEVVGWGSMLPAGEDTARFLQKGYINIVSNEECGKTYLNADSTKSMICAGSGRLSTSACRGDSGGPLFCTDSFNRHVQVGIVSFSKMPCGQINKPTVYTRISEFISWIALNSEN